MLVPRPISSRTTSERRRRAAQHVRRLLHLDHEGALALGEVVARADAREHAVDDADRARAAPGRTSPSARGCTMSATWRMKVDLPAMFGPVTSQRRARAVASRSARARRRARRRSGRSGRPRRASRPRGGGRPRSRARASRRPRGARSRRGGPPRRARSRRPTAASRCADGAEPSRRASRARGRAPRRARPRARRARSSACAILSASASSSSHVKRSPFAIVCLRRHSRGRLVDVRARDLDVPAEDARVAELQARDRPTLSRRRASSSTIIR